MEFYELKQKGKYVLLTLKMLYKDYIKSYKGAMKKFNFFSVENTQEKLNISTRGTNESTIYFRVPLKFRKFLRNKKIAEFQELEDEEYFHYIYSVRKKNE